MYLKLNLQTWEEKAATSNNMLLSDDQDLRVYVSWKLFSQK